MNIMLSKGRWNKMFDWFASLDWYWVAAILAAIVGMVWFFVTS